MGGNKIGNKQQHWTPLDWLVGIREVRFNGARNTNNVALILPEIQLSYNNVRNTGGDKKNLILSLVPILSSFISDHLSQGHIIIIFSTLNQTI